MEEIANIRRTDVDLAGCELFVRKQKTTAARWVPFGEETEKYLLEWLVQRARQPPCPRARRDQQGEHPVDDAARFVPSSGMTPV